MSETVLYLRPEQKSEEEENESMENEDWDDTALLEAYDTAIKQSKQRVAAKLGVQINGNGDLEMAENNAKETPEDPQPRRTLPKREKWRVGMHCGAEYSADGQIYEAVITKVNYENGTCFVRYIGYHNEEEVELSSLRPSKGKQAQMAQKEESKNKYSNWESQVQHNEHGYTEDRGVNSQQSMMIPPPPPPFVMANLPKDETDALSAMLMSWYMSGYHTGYYQGLTRAKSSSQSFNYRNDN